jgi:PAS domain-containing protein
MLVFCRVPTSLTVRICAIATLLCVSTNWRGRVSAADGAMDLTVVPQQVELRGRQDRAQLLVTGSAGRDETRRAAISVEPAGIIEISRNGQVLPLRDGAARLTVQMGDSSVEVPVVVRETTATVVSFREDIIPVLSKAGCNQGACHASQYGKGEFKLSLFGFAPEQDYPQFVRDWRQRRVSFIAPADSLVLKKATMEVAHGGGKRFAKDSYEYALLLDWLQTGAAGPVTDQPHVVGMTVTPVERVYAGGERQQLRVVAEYSDGSTRDVTHRALYDSMGDGVATVDEAGLITARDPGQAAIMVRYQGQAKISMVLLPRESNDDLSSFVAKNFIDENVKAHWLRLGVVPAQPCSDEVFVRRAFLDAIGTLPPAEKVETFLASDAADKREQLVDELLGLTGDSSRDIYVNEWSAYWALKWGDLLRNNRNKLGDGGMWALYNWIRASLRENKPVDRFVREIITAQGSIYANGPANYYKVATSPEDLAETTAQVFLGVRMACAKCHHHPFEVYSQADYYGLAAFFTRVGTKGSTDFGALGRDTVVMLKNSGSIRHPRTGQTMEPTPLLAGPVSLENARDFRRPLANWMTAPENELFARNMVNRFWGYFMGAGLVEPIDDMRATNPASIPSLLDALATDFVASGFDLRHLMKRIMTSRVYQLSSTPRPENVADTRMHLHYNVKRLPAEVLLDAIDDACGTQERFSGVPLGTRAIELPDSNYSSYFLDTTGRPQRVVTCECERTSTPNLAAVLHLVNGDTIQKKLTDRSGRLAKLIADEAAPADAVRELYLTTFSRPPSDAETAAAVALIESAESPQQGLEDVLWALLNSREFLFNH